MANLPILNSLRAKGIALCLGALSAGVTAGWLWTSSQAAWQAYQDRAFVTGVLLFDTIHAGAPAPKDVQVMRIGHPDAAPQDIPFAATSRSQNYLTSISILLAPETPTTGSRMQLHILSPDLQYPVSTLATNTGGNPALVVGSIARVMAQLCSDPVLYARVDQGHWVRIDGHAVWGCAAAPRDNRLWAVLIAVIALGVGLSQVGTAAGQFARFSHALHARGRFGGHDPLPLEGPDELREIAQTVNEYLAIEQERLQKRAMVLSGVSHDLGTPATRLRLRTALIDDPELRGKLEGDIDQMTDMIESVLTYTRAEMSTEASVQVSLSSLVQSIVADYEDVGKPVVYVEAPKSTVEKGRSVFSGNSREVRVMHDDARRVLVFARPVLLRRAITNLIDNALKYGRRAKVSVVATSTSASIMVEDAGTTLPEEAMARLVEPFKRGENAQLVEGLGLGLTIVSTIARAHGGTLVFERSTQGLRAILRIGRY
ncbi:MAG: sensor histidine kinase [Sulfitobacter sp.]